MNCAKCGNEIPERRLKAIPGIKVCVNCSTTLPVKGIVTVIGEGDHTTTDIQIVSSEDYQKLKKLEKDNSRFKSNFPVVEEETSETLENQIKNHHSDESQAHN